MSRVLPALVVAGMALVIGAPPARAVRVADGDTVLTYHRGPTAPTPQWILRFQMGQSILSGDAGVEGAVIDDRRDPGHSNLVVALSYLRAWGRCTAVGAKGRVEVNSLTLGRQTFRLSAWDPLLQLEIGRTALAHRPGSLTPYVQLGAACSFHVAEATALWPLAEGGGPPGEPVSMRIGAGVALEGAVGLDVQASRAIGLNVQAGYRRDEPHYRMKVSGAPDRSGTLHLSAVCIRGGVKLLLGPAGGSE